jgi:hypothetical protein
MTQLDLTLRATVIAGERLKHDYCVCRDVRAVGMIRRNHDRGWDWMINPPLPIPTWGVGREPSLEDAKAAFRDAWARFYAELTPHTISSTGTIIRTPR